MVVFRDVLKMEGKEILRLYHRVAQRFFDSKFVKESSLALMLYSD